jgi:hypothetical protein
MFENEIKFISDFTLNKVKELGSFITVEKLLATDIHPSIKKYVEGEIDYLIFEDRKKLIENSLFDYSGKEISNYFDLIGAEIKKTKKISYEDIKNIILQAVSFNANYVVRPKWSLSKLIYGNSKTVSINEIQLMFSYTYYYEYLNSVFLAYLAKKKILNVSVTEFELIMNKIDRELFMLHQSKLVDNALYGIADYFSIGGLNKSSVSVEAVETFLKEKNLTELLFKLKRNYANSGKKKVDIDEVRKVLYSTLSIDSPFVEETETEDLTVNEKHFENPLKDSFITEDLTETELQQEPEVNEEVVNPKIEAQVEDLPEPAKNTEPEFIEEIQSVLDNTEEIIESIEAAENEQVETDIEKAIEQIEPNKFDLDVSIKEDEINVKDDLIIESKELEIEQVIDESTADEEKELIIEKPKEERTISEEEFLTSLTEEIEKSGEEEIIILDEKEQEDLLNFYDNELEISIDDDLPSPDKKVDESNLDISLDPKIEALEFEHELPETSFSDDGVPIDKIDFQIDLPTVDSEAEKQNEDSLLKVNIKSKTNDIFSYLTNKEIDKIIKNLFNSDSEDFANTVEKMADCNTYDEATHILDSVFKYARIKPHSKDAKLLSSAVAKYFNTDI